MTSSFLGMLQEQAPEGGGAGVLIVMLVYLGIIVAVIAGMWKMFTKAGEPGWAVIVPIYSVIVFGKIAGRSTGWSILLLLIIPVGWFIVPFDIAKKFGKSTGFGVGLLFLGFIFYPILGFGDAKYQAEAPPAAEAPAA